MAVVLHRQPGPEDRLSALLERASALPVIEAEDKMPIQPGHIYLAPADYHLLVESGHLALSREEPVHYARPSVDVLFESAADAYAGRVVGVILTGASDDGAHGLARVKARGGLAIVQDPQSAEARAMPEAAIAAAAVDKILSLEEIGPFLVSACGELAERPAELPIPRDRRRPS
jgi:two-component system chemotaxis response regulator CheB